MDETGIGNIGEVVKKAEYSVVIARPADKVFAYLRNFRNLSQWRLGVLHANQLTRGPTELGTKVKIKRVFLGQLFDWTIVVTEYEPVSKLCFRSTSGPSRASDSCYAVEPTAAGTKVTLTLNIRPSDFFFFNMKESVFAPALQQEVEASLNILRYILEA